MNNQHIKIIDENEKEILQLLVNQDILPDFKIKNNKLIIEKYSTTLGNLELNDDLTNELQIQINSLVDKIHDLNILHGDLHEHNILYNPQTNIVKILDFGQSKLISELTDDDINYYNEFWDTNCESVSDLLKYEYTMWRWF